MTINEFLENKDQYIEMAIDIAKNICPEGNELTTSIESVEDMDDVVKYIRNLYQKGLLDDDVDWNVAVVFGTLLGEMIINKEGYRWGLDDQEVPCVDAGEGNKLFPIYKIHKIITSEEDDEGSPSGFYKGFIALKAYHEMSEEEKEKITKYYPSEDSE